MGGAIFERQSMKAYLNALIFSAAVAAFVSPLWAGTDEDPFKPKSLRDEVFSVETDDQSAAQSLDRISGGKIDLGFASSEQTFKSPDHYRAGPFGRQKTEEQYSSY